MPKIFDLVLYGATGFTGQQAAHYLANHVLSPKSRWAIAGRNQEKLSALLEALPAHKPQPTCLVAEASDNKAICELVSQTKLVVTTAGPFAIYSAELARACARQGVDYLDITGETPFVRQLIDDHHNMAQANGAKMIPLCGFDSVPSDLGSLFTITHLKEQYGENCASLKLFFTLKGGLNGGTMASALDMMSKGQNTQLSDPTLLNPPTYRSQEHVRHCVDIHAPYYEPDLERWVAPFFMAHINTRVVCRSAALLKTWGKSYGENFSYQEAMRMGKFMGKTQAHSITYAIGALNFIGMFKAGRMVIDAFTPGPGSGPSKKVRDNGFFRADIRAVGDAGTKVSAHLFSKGDPGNNVTVKILCEAARCLLYERQNLPGGPGRAGILTPATGLGTTLQNKLEKAGMDFKIDS